MSNHASALGRREVVLESLKVWGLRVAKVVVLLAVLWWLFSHTFTTLVSLVTTHLWFRSIDHGPVHTTMLEAQIGLFCVFGLIAGVLGGQTVRTVRRSRPRLEAEQHRRAARWLFRKHEARVWPLILLAAIVVPLWMVGSNAAGQWQSFLLWKHATPWHRTDPQFHKDISFFVASWPFYRAVVSLLGQTVVLSLWIGFVSSYFYGGWRLRGPGARITRPTTLLLSALLGFYFLVQAMGYWLARYNVVTENHGPVTGVSYTDIHAVIPGRLVLAILALLAAGLLVANAFAIGRLRVIAAAVAVMLAAGWVFGSLGPHIVYTLLEKPSAATRDLDEIAHNQAATLDAFALHGVRTIPYDGNRTLTGKALQAQARRTAQVQLLDPNTMSPTFNVKQELQAYYGFKATLDVDRYDVAGVKHDVALAVRELLIGGVPNNNWVNNHLVYTHGYGIVGAPTAKVDPKTSNPLFLNGGMPPTQDIPVHRPEIYFGQSSPAYSIVGQPAGSKRNLEFDHPGSGGDSRPAHNTYHGDGGIPLGSTLRRLLFAVSLKSPNILFSSDINSASQLLMVRNPRARIAKVAPWLTLDGDVYPVVTGGRIEWVVDGYTTSQTYPDSQLVNLGQATRSSLSSGSTVVQPNVPVNYLRNSVKATVDAYTGQVRLYEWNQRQQPDPLLKEWESIFPGLVRPQSSIPAGLLPHLRYPRDLFNVQRVLLARYHVTDPADFYSGNDFWKVPSDPTVSANQALNTGTGGPSAAGPAQPSTYMSMSPDGFGKQQYSLSSPMVTLNRRDLAAFISINSEPGPDYGKFTVLEYPGGSGGEAPSQVQNDIESSTKISEALTLQRGGNSKVVLGTLQAIPLAGRMLYIEPIYTQAAGASSFPILRHVVALYGDGQPAFDTDLAHALEQAVASGAGG